MWNTKSIFIALAVAMVALPTTADARHLRVPGGLFRMLASPLGVIRAGARLAARGPRYAAIAPLAAAAAAGAIPGARSNPAEPSVYTFSDLVTYVLRPADGLRYASTTDICDPRSVNAGDAAAAKQAVIAPLDWLEQALQPVGAQRDALAEFRTAWINGVDELAATCPSIKASANPPEQLSATADYLSAMWRAAIRIHTPLEKLYGTLSDEQKARLNGNVANPAAQNSKAPAANRQVCEQSARVVPAWPVDRIERQIGPNKEQRASLATLGAVSGQMAEFVTSSCTSDAPATPVGRLKAAESQLLAMTYAVQVIGGPTNGFYSSLSDEQKARLQMALR